MRIAIPLGLLLLAAGCQPFRAPPGVARPGVGVLVQGVAGRCAPVVVGTTVRRVCLPPDADVPADSTASDSVAVTR
jgi:hypothetical protein